MSLWSVGGRCTRCRYPRHVTGGGHTRCYQCFRCGWTTIVYRKHRERECFGKIKDGPRMTEPKRKTSEAIWSKTTLGGK